MTKPHALLPNLMFKFIIPILLIFTLQANAGKAFASSQNNQYHFKVKSGDSLSKYFSKIGLSKRLLANLLSANAKNKRLNRLKIGEKISINLHDNQRFKSLNYLPDNKSSLNIVLFGTKFVSTLKLIKSKTKLKPLSTTTVIIKNSFGYDAQKAGLKFSTINTVVKALSWQLDFNSSLRKGDIFLIVSDGSKKPTGIIYKSGKKRIEAFAHTNDFGQTKYYNRQGHALALSFLKSALKYKRISSKFQLKRYHPILKTYRPHRAVDYAAAAGTVVRSTANGVVKFKGYKGALGKAIEIKHGSDYLTVYAHLSKYARNIRQSKMVKKGQIIGYVGSTGRSTGPHLHYELRYKGKRKNPLTYKLPKQQKISAANFQKFNLTVENILVHVAR